MRLVIFAPILFVIPFRAISQENSACIEDSLVVISADSVSLADTLPEFADMGKFCSPTRGKVISHFGPRHKRFHAGTDIKLQLGDSVRAAFTGIVSRASKYHGYGLLVVLKHEPNIETYYGHLSKILVKVGDTISVGSVIGLGGRTGRATTTHLHFEFRVNHIAFDSEKLFDFGRQLVLADSIPLNKPILKETNITTVDSVPNYDSSSVINSINLAQIQSESMIHTVRRKDTLYSLAKHYGTTVDNLCVLNQIKPNGILHLGQKIRIR
ncbi:MAG: peptidoglycan DD-metalloendopeptidase family protein [Bacteroidales bacterium]